MVVDRRLLAALAMLALVGGSASGAESDPLARGRYLVEKVAMCQECHTPRDAQGALRSDQWLKGGPVFFRPAVAVPGWAEQAPAIAGLTGWTDEDMVYFLEHGGRRTGEVPRPPMKRYRLEHADALAIVAYLRSLGRPNVAPPAADAGVLPAPRPK